MTSQRMPELKRQFHPMQETKEESENLIKNPECIEDNFEKMREKLHWKITLNFQIEFIGQYVLYELLQTHKHYDLYRAIDTAARERVIVKIIDKAALKLGLIENELLLNWQEQYGEFVEKIQIQHEASVALINNISRIFLIESTKLYANSDCIVRVTENYYEEPLSKILLRRGSLPVEEALAIIKYLICALSELHKRNIILTELNPEFIVYKNGAFKISDFSSMRKVGHGFNSTLNLYEGYSYEDLIAPELKVCPEMVHIKSQIWAIGVLFYHMIDHSFPYQERGIRIVKKARAHNITVQTRAGPASEDILSFMRKLLEINPDERISWKKLVNHSLFESKQNFSTIKMMPIVDVRAGTLKKKENDIIQEEPYISSFMDSPQKKKKFRNEIQQIDRKVLFKIIPEDKRFNITKCLDVESQAFFYIQQTNLAALKAVYIYEQILLKIRDYHLIDKKRRSHLETVFLIAERCYRDMKRSKHHESKCADRRIDNYLQQIKKLTEDIKSFFTQARAEYESIDKSTYYISSDIFSIIKGGSKQKERGKMLKGEEGRDFTIQQNVRFTQEKCINKILPQMKANGSKKQQSNVLQSVKINLINYQKINSITLDDLKTEQSFSDVVAKVITAKKSCK